MRKLFSTMECVSEDREGGRRHRVRCDARGEGVRGVCGRVQRVKFQKGTAHTQPCAALKRMHERRRRRRVAATGEVEE